MINGLNSIVKGKENVQIKYTPLPDGKYHVYVEEIKPWVAKDFVGVDINQRDSDGRIVKGDDGKPTKVKATFTAYSADMTLTILDGEFTGRKIFANVTTHPDVLFLLEGFLYAVSMPEITLSDLQVKCKGERLIVDTYNREYVKTKANPLTGIDEQIVSNKTAVRSFLKPELMDADSGI